MYIHQNRLKKIVQAEPWQNKSRKFFSTIQVLFFIFKKFLHMFLLTPQKIMHFLKLRNNFMHGNFPICLPPKNYNYGHISGERWLMVNVLVTGSSGLGSSLCLRYLVVFLGKTGFLTVSLSTLVHKWVPENLMLGVTLRWTSIPFRGE